MIDDEEEKLINKRHEKDELREKLDRDVAEYLARGGKITHLSFGKMTQDVDMREVSFRTRLEREIVIVENEEKKNRETMMKKISAGKIVNLFSDE